MTAEVAFLNKRGIALAADSAVTLANNKVFNNATKLFTLDSVHFIGIMIFGNADLGQVPWEVIIKMYREQLASDTKDTVSQYTEDLINFIEKLEYLDLSKADNEFIDRYFYECTNIIKSDVAQYYQPAMNFNKEFEIYVKTNFRFEDGESLENFKVDKASFVKNNAPELKVRLKTMWPLINDASCDFFINTLWKVMTSSQKFTSARTGLVISGYGQREPFPSVFSYMVDGFLQGKLKYSLEESSIINDSLNGNSSSMIPFAQSDVINTLVHGIDDKLEDFRNKQSSSLQSALRNLPVDNIPNYQSIIDTLFIDNQNAFQQYVDQEFNIPFNQMNSVLSLEELATMAETFISLTSFKRKFSNALESVGGPVDVLVISRGDGPIWVNRKRYFDLNMNQGYTQRRK